MSHFVTIVAMEPTEDVEGKLAEMLAPYDENREVPEYRDYEDGAAENYWLYTSAKRTAEEVAKDDRSSIRPYKPNEIGISSAFDTRYTEEEQWEKLKKEAEAFTQFSNPPTWPEVIEYANNRWYPEGETESNRTDYLRYDEEQDRAYTLSTYNPDSKWDWYSIGGRWSGYFPIRGDLTVEASRLLIQGRRSWTNQDQPQDPWACDGGPKGLLDLDALRDKKGAEAAKRYDTYQEIVEDLPEALPWRVFADDATAQAALTTGRGEITAVWDEARRLYNDQERVRLTKQHDEFKWSFDCTVEEFSVSRKFYIEKARNEAVPGYALVTTTGEWVAPGKMGWFGMSSDSEEDMAMFKAKANGYIDGLSDDTLLIAVDLHI